MHLNQAEMESLYSKRNIRNILQREIADQLDKVLLNWTLCSYVVLPNWLNNRHDKELYQSKKTRLTELHEWITDYTYDELLIDIAYAVIHTGKDSTIQQAVGTLMHVMPHDDPWHQATSAAELLALCQSDNGTGLYTLVREGQGIPIQVQVNHWPILERYFDSAYRWINDTLFNPPLVEPPKEVKDNSNCGYHTIRESLILGSRFAQHDLPQNYNVINTLNQIDWVIDPHVLAETEEPPKELNTDTKKKNWAKQVKESRFLYNLFGLKPFWLGWQYDCRGRINDHGYHIHFQSYQYKKALLSFNKEEYLPDVL